MVFILKTGLLPQHSERGDQLECFIEIFGLPDWDAGDEMPYGAITMTLENGIRFLTDYLEGDTYFKVHYADHNAVRCRAQLKLVRDMLRRLDDMREIIRRISAA